MKTLKMLVVVLSLGLLLTGYTAADEPVLCPKEDSVFMVETPYGAKAIIIPKGFFKEETKGKDWMYLKDFNKEEESAI